MFSNLLRSRWGYAASVLTIMVGLAGFVGMLFWTIFTLTRDLQQIIVPGQHELILGEKGPYTIFYEHRSVVGNRHFSTGGVSVNIQCTVTSAANGSEIPLSTATTNTTYSMQSREGKSIWTFPVDEPGAYRLNCSAEEARGPVEIVLAVGPNRTGRFMLGLFATLLIFFVGIGGGITLLVLTIVFRRKAPEIRP